MINDVRPKDAIKLDIAKLDKCQTYPKEEVLPEDSLYRDLYQPGKQREDQNRGAADFIWS